MQLIHNLYDIQKTYTKEFNMSTVYVTSILALDPWPQTWSGSGLSDHKCQLLPLILTHCGLQQVERLGG